MHTTKKTIFGFILFMLEEVLKPFSRRAAIDQYLAQSHDIFDLEYRIEKLARRGVL